MKKPILALFGVLVLMAAGGALRIYKQKTNIEEASSRSPAEVKTSTPILLLEKNKALPAPKQNLEVKEISKTFLESDPQAVNEILVSLNDFLGHFDQAQRKISLKNLMDHPLEGARTIQNLLQDAPFTEPNNRVQLLSLAIDLIEQMNLDLATMNRESLTGKEVHHISEQIVRHELTAPEWVPLQQAQTVTQETLDNLEHAGEIYHIDNEWVKPTLPAKVMAMQLAARLPSNQQMGISRYVSSFDNHKQSSEVLVKVSNDLFK